LLGGHVYQAHEMAYAGEFMKCGFCGRPITDERKIKKTSQGERAYVYYRCARYNADGHPRIRVGEGELDKQMLAIFDKMRIEDESVREWFVTVLRSKTQDTMEESRAQRLELERQATMVTSQQDRFINMRMNDEINESTFASKQTELRDRLEPVIDLRG
jgi:site-specific DNA recombinase